MAKKNNIKNTSRYLAVEILEKIELEGSYSNLLLRKTINEKDLSKEETNLLTELVYGVIQRKMTLDYQLHPFIKKQKKIENWVIQLLRISLYQFEYLDRIPPHAIVNEAANIARARGHRGVVGLVNGVLRNIPRKGVLDPQTIEPLNKRLSIQYSLPVWLVDEFIQELGEAEGEKLVGSLVERPKLSLRVNLKKISREEALETLTKEGYQVEPSDISPFGIIALNGVPVDSELFIQGHLAVQDESSMLVAPIVDAKPEHQVLDACAAPGGKTMHMATNYVESSQGGQIVALDVHEHKMTLIHENADRQGVADVVTTKELDARNVVDVYSKESFDRILVDAPCSGLGLMRRRPEIRYNKTLADIKNLQKLQLEILNAASKVLKTGGDIVYSTCTITKRENEDVVQAFLKANDAFELIPIELPNSEMTINESGTLSIYPHQYGTDGFYIAKMRKVK